ncbi:hypothetical protein M427DRAFT_75323 [Gonapodya prolifera JEL478]|uniref:Uncharacterized protein n=1 Tax=Gonapodya prolifera (strain JEL478) TaxID=1344416 RepID=A0A138ZYJ4_GONPJ|nr:hypothetical protein M427DRAFT_75323 [Gonapodya prolifera JEL478]|eukprot:KXS09541.1 hypothetical protein M427DRAFT_75323 [Gonapodya prolifera JEL478]
MTTFEWRIWFVVPEEATVEIPSLPSRPADGALNYHYHIVGILRAPDNIAIRALAHYRSYTDTLVREAARTESGQDVVVEAICNLLSRVRGFDVNVIAESRQWSREGSTALLAAAEVMDMLDVARYLLAKTAYADVLDLRSSLKAAIRGDHADMVSLLVDHGADIHANEEELLWYVYHGSVQAVEFLLEQGADPDAPSRRRTKAIAEAKKERYDEVLELVGDHSSECETSECED